MTDPRTDDQLHRELVRLEKQVHQSSERRRVLPPGSSRTKVTTANARWSIACEARDRVMLEIAKREAAKS